MNAMQEVDLTSHSRIEDRRQSRNEDHQWVLAHKEGDEAAFSQLVQKYRRRVFNHCRRLVKDEEDSADLTQEVFIKVFRNIGTYEPPYAFSTWLYRITVNCCIDHFRRQSRHPRHSSLTVEGADGWGQAARERDLPDETYSPEGNLEQMELRDALEDAMSQLSEQARFILTLKEMEGFSYENIGTILNCARGTVKSKVFRAREKLREILTPQVN